MFAKDFNGVDGAIKTNKMHNKLLINLDNIKFLVMCFI